MAGRSSFKGKKVSGNQGQAKRKMVDKPLIKPSAAANQSVPLNSGAPRSTTTWKPTVIETGRRSPPPLVLLGKSATTQQDGLSPKIREQIDQIRYATIDPEAKAGEVRSLILRSQSKITADTQKLINDATFDAHTTRILKQIAQLKDPSNSDTSSSLMRLRSSFGILRAHIIQK